MRSLTPDQLSEAVVDRKLLSANTVEELKLQARRQRSDLIDLITAHGRFPASAVYCAAAEVRGIPFIDYHRTKPSSELAKEFPATVIKRGAAIPVSRDGNRLLVASGCPDDHLLAAEIERRTGLETDMAMAEPEALRDAASQLLTELYPREAPLNDPDPVEAFDRIMKEAYLRRASDVHLDQQKRGLVARIRVDGRLEPLRFHINPEQSFGLISRISISPSSARPRTGASTLKSPVFPTPASTSASPRSQPAGASVSLSGFWLPNNAPTPWKKLACRKTPWKPSNNASNCLTV